MKPKSVQIILIFVAVFVLIGLGCSLTGSAQEKSAEQTQIAFQIEQTVIAKENISLTEQAEAASQAAEAPASSDPVQPTEAPVHQATDTPSSPIFTARETMFCRAGPGPDYPDHWMADAGQSYPVIAKWHESDWLIVEIDDPGTRTKCCWIGGNGDLNVPISALDEINYLPDRINCNQPSPDVKVWDFNTEQYTMLSCGQLSQSDWYFCSAGSGEYCTDVNYDGDYDYLVYQPDADAACTLPADFFKP